MQSNRTATSNFFWPEIIQAIQKLDPIFQQLELVSGELGWQQFAGGVELYRNKLRVTMSQTVVVAVLGGVKAGKSTVFQTLCHNTNVAVTGVEHLTFRPLAFSRDRLEPQNITISDLFPEFDVQITANPKSATRQSEPANRLWWMTSDEIAAGVVIVDCPDLNSMNQINRDLAIQLSKSSDIIFLIMLGGANAYAADIKNFTRNALELGRWVVPVFTKMDDAKSARIVLNEFKREMAPLLAGQVPEFPYAFYVPVIPAQYRTDLRKMQLRSLNGREFINLDDASIRRRIKAEVWNHSYRQFRKQLSDSLSEISTEAEEWLTFWPKIEASLADWGKSVARKIFPRSLVLREMLNWYEETKLTQFRKVMRLINPVNWPSQLYRIWRRKMISQQERQELKERVDDALEKLRSQLDTEANQAWVRIWGQQRAVVSEPLAQWLANHQSNPLRFTEKCNQQVQQSLVTPYISQEWRAAFREELQQWWESRDENARQKRRILEYSQMTVDLISWLALPATFFFPGSLDTLIVGVAQPVLTFINQHFLFIESHFSGARKRWIEIEGRRLKNKLITDEPNLAKLLEHARKWQKINQALRELETVFSEIDGKIDLVLGEKH